MRAIRSTASEIRSRKRATRGARTLTGLLAILVSVAGPVRAQSPWGGAVRTPGSGDVTWVLLSGLVGGTSGFRALERELLEEGHRIIAIDPYHLSIDSADVSFAALARRVNVVLDGLDVTSANVVGHAHGAGVALRVAASMPARVQALYFLDVGALESNRTRVLTLSLRLAPMIASIPGGKGFLRRKLVAGIRENAGRHEWFDPAAQRAYTDPVLAGIGRVVALARRLGASTEPEALGAVVSRVRAPITVFVGLAPHASGPKAEEFTALDPLGARVTVVRLAGVGHFPHEEATGIVAEQMLGRSERATAARVAR